MAYDITKLTKLEALKALAERVKNDYAEKSELTPIAQSAAAAFKSGKVDGNTVSLFASADKTGAAAFTFDFPTEMFLDQNKTAFVGKFTWSAETYPGSTDPGMNNKPVMVLAVKGDAGSVTYSFLNMATLVDTYTAKVEGKDASTTITIAGYEVEVKVNISAEANNQLQLQADGLYVPKPVPVDISGKADKAVPATAGNFAGLDANGNLTDSGKSAADYSKVEASAANGKLKLNGADVVVYAEPSDAVHGSIATAAEVTAMLNEVFSNAAV